MRNKHKFTLIEILFTIVILIVLISISWVAGNKVLKDQNKKKYKAECKMIEAAIDRYHARYGVYPFSGSGSVVNFGEKLSDVVIDIDPDNPSPWGLKRPMYIDYKASGIITNNDNYAMSEVEDATATTLYDPYEEPYHVELNNGFIRVYTNNDLLQGVN